MREPALVVQFVAHNSKTRYLLHVQSGIRFQVSCCQEVVESVSNVGQSGQHSDVGGGDWLRRYYEYSLEVQV